MPTGRDARPLATAIRAARVPVACSIDVILKPDVASVRVTGEVDVATVGCLEDSLRIANESGAPVIEVDLGECSFLSAAGVRALATTAATATDRGGQLVMTDLSRPALHVLDVAAHVGAHTWPRDGRTAGSESDARHEP